METNTHDPFLDESFDDLKSHLNYNPRDIVNTNTTSILYGYSCNKKRSHCTLFTLVGILKTVSAAGTKR